MLSDVIDIQKIQALQKEKKDRARQRRQISRSMLKIYEIGLKSFDEPGPTAPALKFSLALGDKLSLELFTNPLAPAGLIKRPPKSSGHAPRRYAVGISRKKSKLKTFAAYMTGKATMIQSV